MKKAAAWVFKIASLYLLAFAIHAEESTQPAGAAESINVEASQVVEKLASMDELLGLGAPGLALRMVEKYQPQQSDADINQWLRWERKRIQLLQHLQQWQGIISRLESYNELLHSQRMSDYDSQWLLTQKIRALLNMGEAERALYQAQSLLWSVDEYVDSDIIAMWRRLIIRAYLNMGAVDDAQRAMRRYRQDYGNMGNEDGLQWRLLQARLLLQTGSMQDVAEILKEDATAESDALLLLAKLKHKVLSSVEIKKIVLKKTGNRKLPVNDVLVYNYVLLTLAKVEQDYPAQITKLEDLLVNNAVPVLIEVFPAANTEVNANALWQAYESYGHQLANDNKLLIGDDESWYTSASNMFEKESLKARSLLAVLAFAAKSEQHQQLAMEQLVRLIDKQDKGLVVINDLFMKSDRITDKEKIPLSVRYRLVDFALSRADLSVAAKLMENLQQPPEGQDAFAWTLRRARVSILGGHYEDGAQILNRLLDTGQQLTETQIDQFMQVIFDFQNVDQHLLALKSFQMLEQYPLTARLRREISFWKAESYQASKDYNQAAMLFLQSARPLSGEFDPWYHTASFKAAESLAQAGLVEDARRQYLNLLRITDNPARKSMIQQRMQQLRLQQGKVFGEVSHNE